VWNDKEIEENFILDFALDDLSSNRLFLDLPLILYGFLSFGLKLFYLSIFSHEFKVEIWALNLKLREKYLRVGW